MARAWALHNGHMPAFGAVDDAVATYVLIHGKGGGGWMWDPVARLVGAAGHAVHAPTLVGAGSRASEGSPETNLTTHVEQVVSLVQTLQSPGVVLVGHSYGGLVVEGAAAAIPERLAEVVFVDALLVPQGKCAFDALPPAVAEEQRAVALAEGDGWRLPPLTFEEVGGIGGVEPGVSALEVERALHAGRGTHPIGSFEEPVSWDASSLAVPRRFVIGTGKVSPMGGRSASHVVELRAAGFTADDLPTGHFPMLSMPRALTAILLRAGY